MGKYVDGNVIIATILVSAVLVNCIPTSVLINSKASNTADNNKGNCNFIDFCYRSDLMVMDGIDGGNNNVKLFSR